MWSCAVSRAPSAAGEPATRNAIRIAHHRLYDLGWSGLARGSMHKPLHSGIEIDADGNDHLAGRFFIYRLHSTHTSEGVVLQQPQHVDQP